MVAESGLWAAEPTENSLLMGRVARSKARKIESAALCKEITHDPRNIKELLETTRQKLMSTGGLARNVFSPLDKNNNPVLTFSEQAWYFPIELAIQASLIITKTGASAYSGLLALLKEMTHTYDLQFFVDSHTNEEVYRIFDKALERIEEQIDLYDQQKIETNS
jgi:hypothetical protein